MKLQSFKSIGMLLALSLLFSLSSAVLAADSYPNKPVRIIVPYPPGAGTDLLGRVLAEKLGKLWGQPVIVDNRSGAGGTIGVYQVVKAPPDGYTIVLAVTGALTIAPILKPDLPYDPMRDLAPVTQVSGVPGMLAVHPSIAANNVKELIALAKAKPGSLTFGSAGAGTSTHLSGELFKAMAGVEILHVPYKGGGPALTGMLSKEVDMIFEPVPALLPNARAGKIKALAVTSRERYAATADLPTIAETLPGYESTTWYGLLMPAGTPKDIIAKVHADVAHILAMPEVRDRLAHLGSVAIGSTPDAFGAYIRDETLRFKKLIKDANIRIN